MNKPSVIAFEEITPFVRFAGRITVSGGEKGAPRVAYDHRLLLVRDTDACFTINGQDFVAHPSDAVLLLSGVPYSVTSLGEKSAFYCVNFDWLPHTEDTTALPVVPVAAFDPQKRVENVIFTDGLFGEGYAVIPQMYGVREYLRHMVREYERAELLHTRQLSSLLILCFGLIYRQMHQAVPQHGKRIHEDILEYIAENFAGPITNHSVAEKFHYHPNYVSQIVRNHTGLSMHQYLLRLRIHRATELLLSEDKSIAEIAAMTGFANANYFTQYFHRAVGCSPTAFRGGK